MLRIDNRGLMGNKKGIRPLYSVLMGEAITRTRENDRGGTG